MELGRAGRPPAQRAGAATSRAGRGRPWRVEVARHPIGAAVQAEALEEQADAPLHVFVGMKRKRNVSASHLVPGRGQKESSPRSALLRLPRPAAAASGHSPPRSSGPSAAQQSIIESRGVYTHCSSISTTSASAQLQQAVPVAEDPASRATPRLKMAPPGHGPRPRPAPGTRAATGRSAPLCPRSSSMTATRSAAHPRPPPARVTRTAARSTHDARVPAWGLTAGDTRRLVDRDGSLGSCRSSWPSTRGRRVLRRRDAHAPSRSRCTAADSAAHATGGASGPGARVFSLRRRCRSHRQKGQVFWRGRPRRPRPSARRPRRESRTSRPLTCGWRGGSRDRSVQSSGRRRLPAARMLDRSRRDGLVGPAP